MLASVLGRQKTSLYVCEFRAVCACCIAYSTILTGTTILLGLISQENFTFALSSRLEMDLCGWISLMMLWRCIDKTIQSLSWMIDHQFLCPNPNSYSDE